MAERPPTTDLRGGKASADSFARWMANLVVAYAVDFQSDSFSDGTLGSAVWSGDSWRLLWSLPGTDGTWSEMVLGSALKEKSVLR